jgi:hypothetical protein
MRLSKSIVVTAACVLSALAVPAASAAGNSSATGGGTAEEGGARSTFVFNAVEKKDGSVEGHLVYQVRAFPVTIMMDLDCLVVEGNVATMSGVITKVSEEVPGFIFVGQQGSFQVVDNGQGAHAAPDLYSDLFLGLGPHGEPNLCTNYLANGNAGAYIPVSGNIQVR